MGTSHCPQGQLVQWDWCPGVLSPLGCGSWALKVLAVMQGAGFVGARAQVHTSQYMPGPPGSPHSHGGEELGAGGATFVPHPHPRLPPDTAADATRRRHLRQRKLPLLRAGDKSRLLLHPLPLCPLPPSRRALPPPSLLALGTWLPLGCPSWGDTPQGGQRWECCHPRMAAHWVQAGCSRDAPGILEGCLGSPLGKPGTLWV